MSNVMRKLENISVDVIVPVYNEEKNIRPFLSAITTIFQALRCKYKIIFINDGSIDQTAAILSEMKSLYSNIINIHFTRNFGKEIALTAGLEHGKGDVCIPIDVDLQHPVALIPEMLSNWENGFDQVIAVRKDRDTDSLSKRALSQWFYKLFNAYSIIKIPKNAGDFRLMSRCVVNRILQCPERTRFMKGLFAWAGGKSTFVYFDLVERTHDKSRFNFIHLMKLAIDGMTAFSSLPLRLSGFLGIIICFFSGFFGIYLIIKKLITHQITPGYTSLIVVILFFGGVQLLSLGVIGEYVSRIFTETKQRPLYLVDRIEE